MFTTRETVQYINHKGKLRKGEIVTRDVDTHKYYVRDLKRKDVQGWIDDFAITGYLKN